MGDIYTEYCEDQEEYLRLCSRFEEQTRYTERGNPDCYGKHAEALKKRAEKEDKEGKNE